MEKQKIVFLTDLDNTILYSQRRISAAEQNVAWMEERGAKTIGYVTKQSKQYLQGILNSEHIVFVPCTMRTFEQALRIHFIRSYLPRYMILENGGIFYFQGKESKEYYEFLEQELGRDSLLHMKEMMLYLQNLVGQKQFLLRTHKNLIGSFLYVLIGNPRLSMEEFEAVFRLVRDCSKKYSLRCCRQGRKIYILPYSLDKSLGLRYMKEKGYVKDGVLSVGSGDSVFDQQFLDETNIAILPKHAEIYVHGGIRTKRDGLFAGEDILQYISKL